MWETGRPPHRARPRRTAHRPQRPYQQGALDGLCGVYAVTNALALLCPELSHRDCERMFRALLRQQLGDRAGSVAPLWTGCGRAKLMRLLKAACTVVAKRYHAVTVRRLKKPASHLDDLWAALKVEVTLGHIVILGLSGVHWHWTVVERITPGTLWLSDSDGLRLLRRSHCTLEPQPRRHRLDPREIFVLRRDEPGLD